MNTNMSYVKQISKKIISSSKFLMSLILGLAMTFSFAVPAFAAITVNTSPTSIDIISDTVTEYSFTVTNASTTDDISNFKVTANLTNGNCEVVTGGNGVTIPKNSSHSFTVSMYVQASKTSGAETLSLDYSSDGGAASQTVAVYVSVPTPSPTPTPTQKPEQGSPNPELTMIAPTTYITAQGGVAQNVTVTLKNISSYAAKQITIVPKANKDFVVEYQKPGKTFSISGNKTQDLIFKVVPNSKIQSGDYAIAFDYSFLDDSNDVYKGSFTYHMTVPKSAPTGNPVVVLKDFIANPSTVTAGEKFTFTLNAANTSAYSAELVDVVLKDLSADKISVFNSTNNRSAGTLKGSESKSLSFDLTSSKELKTGSYPITVDLSYKDSASNVYTESYTYYVNIKAKNDDKTTDDSRGVIEIVSVTRPTSTYGVGSDIKISLMIKNTGNKTAKNIKLTASPDDAIVPKSANIQMVNSLDAGQTKTFNFTFAATASAKSQNYNIGFTAEYETGAVDESDVKLTDKFMQYVGVNISNPEADKDPQETDKPRSIPKIIVSKYIVDPIIVQAGQEFDLDLIFKNTHKLKTVYNIKVALSVIGTETDKGNVFTPVNSSNTFYIDNIQPNGESSHHMRMYTVPDAKPKNYIITIKFEYEDEEGNQLTAVEEVGVNVQQVSKYELGEVAIMPPSGMVNEPVEVMFNIHNTGKVTLNNLKVRIEGEGIMGQNSEIIFGNFASGSFDTYDGYFTPTTAGEHTFDIIVSYNDDNGELIKEVITKDIFVSEGMGMGEWGGEPGVDINGEFGGEFGGDYGEPMPENQSIIDKILNMSVLMKVAIFGGSGLVLVIIIVVIIVAVVKSNKKKRLGDFDDEE